MLDLRIRKKQGRFDIDAAFISSNAGVTALFGSSGAGKTSIINMVAGLVRPDKGHIIVNGQTLFDAGRGIDVLPERRRIGYIFQDGRLFPHFSVHANLTYGMRMIPPKKRYLTFDQVVELLGIGHLLNRSPANLSGGEKQRVAIGRALLTSPSLLLMDEPLASLDQARKDEVLPFIARLTRELSIPTLYVSHSLNEVLNLADTMVLLDEGKVVGSGEIDKVISRVDLRHLTGIADHGSVISTYVESHDQDLSSLRFKGGVLKVPRLEIQEGARIRVRVQARNVAISLERPAKTSFQNIIPARVEEIVHEDGPLVDVRLNIGCMLLARITPAARKSLGLKPGKQVFALIKSLGISTGSTYFEEQ